MRGRRGVVVQAGLLLGPVLGLALAGCGSGPVSPGPSTEVGRPDATDGETVGPVGGSLVAVPPDGADPGTGLDVGGPGLARLCEEGDQPIPVDSVLISCQTGEEAAPPGLGTSRDVSLDPGTYWAVLVCSGPGEYVVQVDVPGLAADTTLTCDEDGRAVREKLGTVTTETTADVINGPTAAGTFAFWVVREGKTEL